jgi:hypothetical protein
MKNYRSAISVVILVWVLSGLSCRLGTATPVPPTQQGQGVTSSVENVITETITPETQVPPVNYLLPSGVLIDTLDKVGITFFNTNGQVITELKTPGLQHSSPSEVHLAGTVSGQIMTPLVFHVWDPQSRVLINVNDAISLMANAPNFYSMAGASGQSVMVYSVVNYKPDNSGITSNLYFGTLEQLTGGGGLVYSEDNNQSYADFPLEVNAENNVPLGFWFSHQAYGIGDVIFAPQKGLFYYNQATNSIAPVLDETRRPLAISQDHNWVASNAFGGDKSVTALNINTNTQAYYPLLANSDDGAGNVTFSPDSNYIAWMEASGSFMMDVPNFHSVVRIAQTNGTLVRDVIDVNFGAVVGAAVNWVQPVEWLDTSVVLVQALGMTSTDAWVLKLDVTTGNISLFATGNFVGLYYP